MIVKVPSRFIDNRNGNSIREYYINPSLISYVDVNMFTHNNEDALCSVLISMQGGLAPMLKNMSVLELQDFIMWWNKSLNIEKLNAETFGIKDN